MVNVDILKEIGLSGNEIDVYLALLKLKSSTANEISKHSKVHRTNVYDTLTALAEKGLVSYVVKDGKKFFMAEEPERLLILLKEREERLLEIIPTLKFIKSKNDELPEVNVYRGVTAFRMILEELLELNETIYVYGAPPIAVKVLGPFIQAFHRKRISKKVKMMHIYSPQAATRVAELNRMKYTYAKTIPERFESLVSVNVCGDIVVFMFWTGASPKQLPIIRIKNKLIAESFRNHFRLMWEFQPNKKDPKV